MNPVEATPAPVGEAKARQEISWLVNEAFVTLNLTGTCCSGLDNTTDIPGRVTQLCKLHPQLAAEYYELIETGEKVTPLEALLRNRHEARHVQDFCNYFPQTLGVKSFANQTYPLHIACEEFPHGESHIIIPFLAKKFPEAVRSRDCDDNLPLHKVCSWRKVPKETSATSSKPTSLFTT